MKTAKILSFVAIGVALVGIGVTVFLYYKSKNQNQPLAMPIATTRVDELAEVIE